MNALAFPRRMLVDEASSRERRLTRADLEQAVSDALPRWLRMAQRLSGDPEVAEEAVQDALVRVARSWTSFRGEAALETWIARIVIHSVRDRMRARRSQPVRSDRVAGITSNSRGPVETALACEQQQRVREAIGDLPDRQREVLSLTIWETRSPAEVADLLEINVQNVYATLHAARQRLKDVLRDA